MAITLVSLGVASYSYQAQAAAYSANIFSNNSVFGQATIGDTVTAAFGFTDPATVLAGLPTATIDNQPASIMDMGAIIFGLRAR